MKPEQLAQGILKRAHKANQMPGAEAARALMERNLKRLNASIGDGMPDSGIGWMAIVECGKDRASVQARLATAEQNGAPGYGAYKRIIELLEKARKRKAAAEGKPYEPRW